MFDIQEILKALQLGGNSSGAPNPAPQPDPTQMAAATPAVASDAGPMAGIGGMLGLNDGKGGPAAFGGLLNFKDEDSKQAALRGMLGASANLMALGGPSDRPSSFLGNVGQAIGTGVGAADAYKDGLTDRAFKKAQTDRYGVANAQDLMKLKQQAAADEARRRLFGGAGFDGGSNTGATAGPASASGSPALMPVASAAPTGGTDLATQINNQRATYQQQYNGLMSIGDGDNARPIFAQMNFLDNEAAKQGLVWDGTKYTAAPGYNEGVQNLKESEATGTALGKRNEWTTDRQNYEWIKGSNDAAGLLTANPNDWMLNQKKAGSTQVNIKDGNKYGTIPQGYRLVEGPNGAYMEAIPGSPDAVKAEQAKTAKDSKGAREQVSSDAVDTAFNNVIRVRNASTLPTNGFFGGMLDNVGGTGANDVRAALNTLKANASLTTLQKMRDESPTGAGMGNPTDNEQALIQAAYSTLEQSQSDEEFIRNLNNFRNLWMDLVHGEGNGPARYPTTYGLNPLTAEEQAKANGTPDPSTTSSTNNAEWKPRSSMPATPPVRISGDADYAKLPSGTRFIGPDGLPRTKP